MERLERLLQARLYLVCDERDDEFLHAALRGGVDIVQLRMKDAQADQILRTAARFRAACDVHGTLFILNDRPELVIEASADGVHIGQDDMPPDEARELLGSERIVGLSTHSREQVGASSLAPVDYIGVGPVNQTPTKAGRPAVGLELVRYAAAHAERPFFAIGGIDRTNVAAVLDAGAQRIAVVRALTLATDPEQAAHDLATTLRGDRVGAT